MPHLGSRVLVRASGERGVIVETHAGDLFSVALAEGDQLLHADELEAAAPTPIELLSKGELGDPESYALRLQAEFLRHAYRFDPLSGLSNARIEPQPHQVFVAWRVNHKLAPRMILADEVGLGKTIEAGLIIKELRARGLADRILIVCPSSLQLQWQQELQSKFNESFEVLDSAAMKYLGKGGANPWARFDSVICSLPFASHRTRQDAIIESDWDLVVFDEAHRVRRWRQGKQPKVTQAYRLADELKELTTGLLLLSATPMQLDPFELYSLVELVEPGLFPSYSSYEAERAKLPHLNALMRVLQTWDGLDPARAIEACDPYVDLLGELGIDAADLLEPTVREVAADDLAAKHPLAEAMVRNRKSEIGGFVGRHASSHMIELSAEELDLYQDITDYIRFTYDQAMATKNQAMGFLMVAYQKMLASSTHAIRASFEKRIKKLKLRRGTQAKAPAVRAPDEDQLDAEEMSSVIEEFEDASVEGCLLDDEIEQLEALVARLRNISDSKAHGLLEALQTLFDEHPEEKVLIFTTFKETQSFLRRSLEDNGHTVSVFNGSMSLDEKEDAVRAFREPKGRILVSTEAGGEGRNFQFCHIVVNYDLPWNPMKVEQRIGRVDRIGQRRPIEVWNLACTGTIEERILEVLHRRIRLFEESVGSLEPILGAVEDDIVQLVMRKLPGLADEAELFEADLEERVRGARVKEAQLADFALDRASLRRDAANELLNQPSLAGHRDLEQVMSAILRLHGGALHEHADGGRAVTLSPQLARTVGIRTSSVRGCFDPQEALRHEDLPFLAFGHPFIESLLNLAAQGATTAARVDPTLDAGTYLELWYVIESFDLRPTGHFMRHLVGSDLSVSSAVVDAVPPAGERGSAGVQVPDWAAAAMAASQRRYQAEYAELRVEAATTLSERKAQAGERARRVHEYRVNRTRVIITDEAAWIARAEAAGNERERKVLPARRGKLEKRRSDLARMEEDHQRHIEEIERQSPRTSGRVIAAGLVMGS